MKILAFDTALDACSAALFIGHEVKAAKSETRARGHAERLVPMIEELMAETGWAYGQLDLLCVTRGPGSFTGLRIGLATARGFAVALDLPVLGFGTLEALAAGLDEAPAATVLALIDARRGQLYAQAFDRLGANMGAPAAVRPEEIAAWAPSGPLALVGTGVGLALPHFEAAGREAIVADAPALPDAARFGRLAVDNASRAVRGEPPGPLYLRAPDAKPMAEPT